MRRRNPVGDHLRSNLGIISRPGIICGPIWGSFPVQGSFAVQFGDHFRSGDHLRACTGPIAVPCFCTKLWSENWQLLTSRQISTASKMQSVDGNLSVRESSAFLTAVIPKLLSMLGNMATTSQDTNSVPGEKGPLSFRSCTLLRRSVVSLTKEGRL